MHVPAEKPQKFKDVVDVIVEVEAAFDARYEARVLPFGKIDLMVRQEVADRAAE